MGFELRDHTADIAVAATGATLETVFAAVADGLAAAGCESIPAAGGSRFSVTVTADGREALLFDYLDELIYQRDVRSVLPANNRVERIERRQNGDGRDGTKGVDGDECSSILSLEASARGMPLDSINAREVKAVTYSEMRLEETDGGWEAYVVFDV